jgi:peroxiredoxin
MNQLHTDLHSQGLEVVAVNLDEELVDAQTFLTQNPPQFTVVADVDQHCARLLALKAMPSTYLIDRKGIIRATHLGFRAGEAAEFRKTVEAVLKEAP